MNYYSRINTNNTNTKNNQNYNRFFSRIFPTNNP